MKNMMKNMRTYVYGKSASHPFLLGSPAGMLNVQRYYIANKMRKSTEAVGWPDHAEGPPRVFDHKECFAPF